MWSLAAGLARITKVSEETIEQLELNSDIQHCVEWLTQSKPERLLDQLEMLPWQAVAWIDQESMEMSEVVQYVDWESIFAARKLNWQTELVFQLCKAEPTSEALDGIQHVRSFAIQMMPTDF